MQKILNIIGARPQIIKSAAISRALSNNFAQRINEIIIHTGQHYDHNMSQVFFEEMKIPKPTYNLNIGSGNHGKQTALMIEGIENIILNENPDGVIVYGDTNSTLAAALAASKLHCPVAHIEAGLRSFNKKMPEEINRIMCDHVSSLLFAPTESAIVNLQNEGFKINSTPPFTFDTPGIFHCGDVMYDNSLFYSSLANKTTSIFKKLNLSKDQYVLSTIHRNNNTDEPKRLTAIFEAIYTITQKNNIDFVIPLHPRTAKLLDKNIPNNLYISIRNNKRIKIIEPVSFLDITALESNAKMILTDSGGLQKEAFFFKKPCVILRSETEWVELVKCGAAIIADADKEKIISAFQYFNNSPNIEFPSFYGDGHAADFICEKVFNHFQ